MLSCVLFNILKLLSLRVCLNELLYFYILVLSTNNFIFCYFLCAILFVDYEELCLYFSLILLS